jgi:hypothetical protein
VSHKHCQLCGVSGSHSGAVEVFYHPYVTQYYLVVLTYLNRLSGTLKMRPTGWPEMSATKYQALLLNIPEGQRPHLSTVLASIQ